MYFPEILFQEVLKIMKNHFFHAWMQCTFVEEKKTIKNKNLNQYQQVIKGEA